MIYKTPTRTAEVSEGLETSKFGINNDRIGVLMQMLSTGIYSNPLGSVIREYTSNSWDAHKEAGQTRPILVECNTDDQGRFLQIKDFGTGLPFDKFQDLFIKYLGTNKDQSNDALGAFGIGSKSAFSVADSYYVSNRYNGKEETWLMFKDGNLPDSTKISTLDTDEENGVTVKIYINSSDYYNINDIARKELMYFSNVELVGDTSFNEREILEGELFTYCTKQEKSELHIKSGVVTFPIDFNQLGISAIYIPVALNFEIGELEISISRESLNYTKKTKQLILDRIELLKEDLLSRVETHLHFDSFENYFRKFEKDNIRINLKEGVSLNISTLARKAGFKLERVTVEGFGKINFLNIGKNTILGSLFDVTKKRNITSYPVKYTKVKYLDNGVALNTLLRGMIEDLTRIPSHISHYISHELNVERLITLRKPVLSVLNNDGFTEELMLKVVPKASNNLNNKLALKIQKAIVKEFSLLNLSEIEPDEEWVKNFKKDYGKSSSTSANKTEITFSRLLNSMTHYNSSYKYKIDRFKISKDDLLDPTTKDLSKVVISSDRLRLEDIKSKVEDSDYSFWYVSETNFKWLEKNNVKFVKFSELIDKGLGEIQQYVDNKALREAIYVLNQYYFMDFDFLSETVEVKKLLKDLVNTKKELTFVESYYASLIEKGEVVTPEPNKDIEYLSLKAEEVNEKYEDLKFFNKYAEGVSEVILNYFKLKKENNNLKTTV